MVTIISLLSCIAIMAVGVYAAQQSFTVQVENKIDIQVTTVNGTLWGKRVGDVVLGTKSMGDEGIAALQTAEDQPAKTYLDDDVYGEIPEFIELYANDVDAGYKENAENMAKIKAPVNFYLSAKNGEEQKKELTIAYVFKFQFFTESPTNVTIALKNNTTQLADSRKSNVTQKYLYYFGENEPADWSANGINSFGIESTYGATKSITVEGETPSTHTVYIYASLTVKRTETLASAYTLGIDGDEFIWGFNLSLTPEMI